MWCVLVTQIHSHSCLISSTGTHFDISGSDEEGTPQPTVTTDKAEKRKVIDIQIDDDHHKKSRQEELHARATRLVSYGPDDVDEGEGDGEEDEIEIADDQAAHGVQHLKKIEDPENYTKMDAQTSQKHTHDVLDNDVQIPPEPPGKCSNKLQEKITRLYEKMRRHNLHMNESIQRRKDFRNPSIYEKLIDFCGIDEKGTNYPPELYNPSIWGKESYYDALAKVQLEDMEKREKERRERTKIEFVVGTKKSTDSGERRKSKWDSQPVPAAAANASAGGGKAVANSVPVGTTVVSGHVTTSASGTKTTVISAVGTLKKPKWAGDTTNSTCFCRCIP